MGNLFFDEVHAHNVLQRMWEQTERKELCDVLLIPGDTEDMQISAHRSVLSASSEYFKSMFTPPFNESTAKEVKFPNVDGETLKSLVKFCYSGRLEISEDTSEKLFITADFLRLDGVVTACSDFLVEQLHPTNCLGMVQLAERHHCELFSKKATDFCMEHFVELYKTDEFLNLSVERLTQLLTSNYLHDPTEEHVFKSLMIWLEHDRYKRDQYRDVMLKLVRLPLLEPSFLFEHVEPACTSPVSLQLYTDAVQWHLMSESRTVNASEFIKPRRSYEHLMAIIEANNKLDIMYHCPQRLTWIKWLESLEYRESFGVAVMGDELFIVGGYIDCHPQDTVICLNLKTVIPKIVNRMCERRAFFGVAVINGFLYAVGGLNSEGALSSVERWDSKSNTWNIVASMSAGRYDFGCKAFNGKIYVTGGGDGYIDIVSSAECYNPQEDVWTPIASMCEARKSHELVVANGMLYTVGGDSSSTIERYEHETNKWTVMCSFSQQIFPIFYKKFNNRVIAFYQDRVEEYNTTPYTTFNDKVIAFYQDRVEEYNTTTNKCKVNISINRLEKVRRTFSFSGSLFKSKFKFKLHYDRVLWEVE